MEDLIEDFTGGHVAEVKLVLTSVVAALALYQALLMSVVYGKLRLPFLKGKSASFAHRSLGDTIVPITLLIAVMCLGYFGIEDGWEHGPDRGVHMVSGFLLLVVLAIKIAVLKWWHGMSRFLPLLGMSVLALFLITWAATALFYL